MGRHMFSICCVREGEGGGGTGVGVGQPRQTVATVVHLKFSGAFLVWWFESVDRGSTSPAKIFLFFFRWNEMGSTHRRSEEILVLRRVRH